MALMCLCPHFGEMAKRCVFFNCLIPRRQTNLVSESRAKRAKVLHICPHFLSDFSHLHRPGLIDHFQPNEREKFMRILSTFSCCSLTWEPGFILTSLLIGQSPLTVVFIPQPSILSDHMRPQINKSVTL